MQYAGPVAPGTNPDYFRWTGRDIPVNKPAQTSSSAANTSATLSSNPVPDPFAAARQAAQDANNAQLSQANTAFDYSKAQLEGQLGSLGTQKDQSLAELDTGLSGVRTQVGNARTNSQTNTDSQIAQAGSVAKSTQDQNRNVLRALGILNSSAAGELLSKPINEFDKQRATLNTGLGQRFQELDDFLNQKVAEASDAKNRIVSQYTDLYGKIQTDLRFNERQRVDAIQAANAAVTQRLADIQSSLLNYQNAVSATKQSFATGIQGINSYQDPTYNKAGFSNLQLTNPNNPQTASIYANQDQQKKQQGLLSAY